MLSRIHDLKNRMIGPKDFEKQVAGFSDEAVVKVYPLYQAALRENNAVDFDDIILLAVRLFQENPAVLEAYQTRFQHLLVDEYQDTNKAQYTLVALLAAKNRNLACVGDDDQGIYAWRGADIQNILDFQKDYPDAKVVKLVRNYRSTKNILRSAMAVISKNRGRFGKELWTENPTGDSIKLYVARDEREEGRWIAEEVQRLVAGGRKRSDAAIFYRTNAQSRALEEGLRARGIPYRLVGALRFFERAEIKDSIAYLRAAINPADSMAIQRILGVPPRGIGDTTIDHLERFAALRSIPFADAIAKAEEIVELKPAARKKLAEFHALMTWMREEALTVAPAAFLRKLLDQSGYLEWLGRQTSAADEGDVNARVDNVGQLIASAGEFSMENPNATAADFLDRISLLSDVDDYDESADAVTMMTFHAAKGLEFPVVFMTGMEEGIFPHSRVLESDGGVGALEEERRLCYVGMTRARQRLYLTLTEERASWGARRPLGPSRFLAEIPSEIVEVLSPPRPRSSSWEERPRFRGRAGNDDFAQPSYDEFDQRPAYDDDAPEPRATSFRNASAGVHEWKPGMRIVHSQFGPGEIREVEGGGDNAKLAVAFDKGGMRKLLVKYAAKDLRIA
jgi:DNA helicase-2/ATP-dependent DNA helicase PcrA